MSTRHSKVTSKNKIPLEVKQIIKELRKDVKDKFPIFPFKIDSSQKLFMWLEVLSYNNPKTALPILDYMISFNKKDQICFAANDKIGDNAGCGYRMVQYFKKHMIESGIITTKKRFHKNKKYKNGHENYNTEIHFNPSILSELIALKTSIKDLKNFKNCSKLLRKNVIDNGLSFSDLDKNIVRLLTKQIKPVRGVNKDLHSKPVRPYYSPTFFINEPTPIGMSFETKNNKNTFDDIEYIKKMADLGFNDYSIFKLRKALGLGALEFAIKIYERDINNGKKIPYARQWFFRVAKGYQKQVMINRNRWHD